MRCASLSLRREMLKVGCNSSGISFMSAIEWPGWLKWEETAAVAFAWSGLFVAIVSFWIGVKHCVLQIWVKHFLY